MKYMKLFENDIDWDDFDYEEEDYRWKIVDFSVEEFRDQFYILTKTIDDYNVIFYKDVEYSSRGDRPVNLIYKEMSKIDLDRVFNNKASLMVYDYHNTTHKYYGRVLFKDLPEEVKKRLI